MTRASLALVGSGQLSHYRVELFKGGAWVAFKCGLTASEAALWRDACMALPSAGVVARVAEDR